METKKTVTLDLTGCKSLWEVHQRIQKAFNFPDFYGKNWSAFWDLLWSDCDADLIIVLGIYTLPKDFDWHRKKLLEILQRLQDSRAKQGALVEIEIRDESTSGA